MFITLEGPEGAGKTSHVSPLVEFIRQQGYPVLSTYEPGGTPISDQVRDVLKNMKNKDMHPRTEILLFCSARAQLVEEVIRPGLAKGYVVIADRYADSTLAYQGYGHGEDLSFLRQLLNYATGSLWPDLTLLLDISAEDGLQRKREQKKDWNRFEDYDLSFHRRVRQGYLELVRSEPQRWHIVDASQSYDEVQEELRRVVLQKLAGRQDKGVV
jgi:dTMP kinase